MAKKNKNEIVIAVDFDGTMVTHDYPRVGKDIGAFEVLKKIQESGHKIILYTMRSRKQLDEAINLCVEKGIELYGINRNPMQHWTESPKCYAHLYIDDAALNIPLINDREISDRPFVDWKKVEELLKESNII